MKVQEQGSLAGVIYLPVDNTSGSLDHAAPADQMEAIDAIMRFYFGVEGWLAERNRRCPGLRS